MVNMKLSVLIKSDMLLVISFKSKANTMGSGNPIKSFQKAIPRVFFIIIKKSPSENNSLK